MVRSNFRVQQWDTGGHQIGPEYSASYVAISIDGTQFALCGHSGFMVQDTRSGAKLNLSSHHTHSCCFSPDGKLIAACEGSTAHVWNMGGSDPLLIEIFKHSEWIRILEFSSPSSLISALDEKLVKFWQIDTSSAYSTPSDTLPDSAPSNESARFLQIGTFLKFLQICTSSMNPVKTNLEPFASNLAQAYLITLQAMDDIIITCDSGGVLKMWDFLSGHLINTFQTPLPLYCPIDIQLVDDNLLSVWHDHEWILIWEAGKQGYSLLAETPNLRVLSLRISEDGSKIFCLAGDSIHAWFMQTGEWIGTVAVEYSGIVRPLTVEGPRVWVLHPQSGWEGGNFEVPNSPVQLSEGTPSKVHPKGTILWDIAQSRIQDTTSRKVLFQLSAGFGMPVDVGWKHQYLLVLHLERY